ncbi:unnamed protein product [Lota lota]
MHLGDFPRAPPDQWTQGGDVETGLLLRLNAMRPADGAPCCHAEELSPSVCGGGWFNLCTLIAQCATGVQPHPAPESNQSDSGQVRLLKPAPIHTHSHIPPTPN